MALPTTITGLSTVVAIVGPFKCDNAPGFKTSNTGGAAQDVGRTNGSGTPEKTSQTFSVPSDTVLSSLVAFVQKINSPTDSIQVELRSSGPTGTLITTSDNVSSSGLSGDSGGSATTFTFSSPPTLTASTTYCLVFQRSSTTSNTNYYKVSASNDSSYAGGGANNLVNGSWVGESSTVDVYFTILSGAPAYYLFGRDAVSANPLDCYKATDPSDSWSQVATQAQPSSGLIQFIAGVVVSDRVHLAVQAPQTSTSNNQNYSVFDMMAESFTVQETVQTGFNSQNSSSLEVYECSIALQGTQPTIFYAGARVASMGNSYTQLYERHRTGVSTWSAGQQITTGGTNDFANAEMCAGSSSRVHMLFRNLSGATYNHRAMNSSYTLQTAASYSPSSGTGAQRPYPYLDGATTRVVMTGSGTSLNGGRFNYFNSADTPTINLGAEDSASDQSANYPYGQFYAGPTGDVWMFYGASTLDLYVSKSSDDGATLSGFATAHTGSTSNDRWAISRDQHIYVRGLNLVIPYVILDGGVWKYDEYTIATAIADAWSAVDKDPTITLSNSDKKATASGSTPFAVRSTTSHASTSSTGYYAEIKLDVASSGGQHGLKRADLTNISDSTDLVAVSSSSGLITVSGLSSGVSLGALSSGDVISVAWIPEDDLVWFRLNAGNWNNDGSANPATGTNGINIAATNMGNYCLVASLGVASDASTVRTEAAEFTQVFPAGFKSWMDETLATDELFSQSVM